MSVILCPGVHDPALTQGFITGLQQSRDSQVHVPELKIFPAQQYPAYSALHVLQFLQSIQLLKAVVFIGFSAGVVGAIGAAWAWQQQGGQVKALIAVDGWGVPLYGDFPIHRVSHDYFTHWSSALLGRGQSSFYADPAVDHLDLWRSPHTAQGWRVDSNHPATPATAAQFLTTLLQDYGELLIDPETPC